MKSIVFFIGCFAGNFLKSYLNFLHFDDNSSNVKCSFYIFVAVIVSGYSSNQEIEIVLGKNTYLTTSYTSSHKLCGTDLKMELKYNQNVGQHVLLRDVSGNPFTKFDNFKSSVVWICAESAHFEHSEGGNIPTDCQEWGPLFTTATGHGFMFDILKTYFEKDFMKKGKITFKLRAECKNYYSEL